MTARAATEALRRRDARRLVLAVPVCAAQMAETLCEEVEELICLKTPPNLMAVGLPYGGFYQVENKEVVEMLECAGREQEERSATEPQHRRGVV